MVSETSVDRRIVDNRVFILGLDWMYRRRMADIESTRLLDCARKVARALRVSEAQVPVEGYYVDSPELTEYFRLMRALQTQDESAVHRVKRLPEYDLLYSIATSGLYGLTDTGYLLPRGLDPLAQALLSLPPSQWTLPGLVTLAHTRVLDSDDFSLVGLAAHTADPVAIAATRESVVLYALAVFSREPPRIEYVWRVDADLSARASRFITTLNQFVNHPLPPATARYAEHFFTACGENDVYGRCVMIGMDQHAPTKPYYHWAITGASSLDMHVREFWARELWTTARYTAEGMPQR